MELVDFAALGAGRAAALRRRLQALHTLGDLLDWGRRRRPPLPAPHVVTQDEYTHDVLLPYAGLWLDFDTT